MRIAIIGTGISGLACAWLLGQRHEVVVYEAADRLGGHAHTLAVPWQGGTLPVDTGFMVYNERNYPNLARLLAHLGVATRPTDMSFGVSIDGGRIEYAGTSLRTLFAQRRNLLRPGFHRMWCDILRFNGDATRFLAEVRPCSATLGEFLDERGYGWGFCQHYLLPMAAAIWSATIEGMRSYPARSLLRFFANHGLLQLKGRPQWRTVVGGAATYVERLGAGLAGRVRLACPVRAVRRQAYGIEVVDGRGGRQRFDQVVLACHADQALALIEAPGAVERAVLRAFRYQRNRAVLHRDPALMPRRRSVWSSWNYLARSDAGNDGVSVTYWLNRLQGLEPDCLLLESLNPVVEPAPASVIAELDYRHPQHDAGAVAAQGRRSAIQGQSGLWYAGAYWGYGFHEDGLRSGLEVAAALGCAPPWWPQAPLAVPATRGACGATLLAHRSGPSGAGRSARRAQRRCLIAGRGSSREPCS